MKSVLFTLLPVFLSICASAQGQPAASGATFSHLNVWSNASASTLPANKPTMTIDSASGVINIQVTDLKAESVLNIYDLLGNLLYKRALGLGNNVITLAGMTREMFVFCVEYGGSPLYSMKIVRK
jgi:hypothetical protein